MAVYLSNMPSQRVRKTSGYKYFYYEFSAVYKNEWKLFTVMAEFPKSYNGKKASIKGSSPSKEFAKDLMNHEAHNTQQQALNERMTTSFVTWEDEDWEIANGKVQLFLQIDRGEKYARSDRLTWYFWTLEEIDLATVG